MINRELDTGPRPLAPKESAAIQRYLRFSRVDKDVVDGTYFSSKTGMFSVGDEYTFGLSETLWCKELVGRDPNNYVLRVARRGVLLIQTLSGEVERTVNASDIREVSQSNSGRFRVYSSGYLLLPGPIRVSDDRLMPAEEFQQVLLAAERGIRPPILDPWPFIKVDPELVGQTLHRISFRQQTEPFWMEDAVVVGDNGQLVPRIIYHSLSPHRWG